MRKLLSAVRRAATDRSNVVEAIGATCITVGVAQWSTPAAWVTAGVLLIAGAAA